MKKTFFLFSLALLQAACSSSPSSVLPPAKLPVLENKVTIERLWERQIGNGASDKFLKLRPVLDNNTGYAIDHTGQLFAWDIKTGKTRWSKSYSVPASTALVLRDNYLYFGTSNGEIFVVNKKHGKVKWRSSVSSEVLAPPVITKSLVVVQTVDGGLHAINRTTGQRNWFYSREMPVLSLRGTSTPLIVGDIVISGADNGKLIALTLNSGAPLWETPIAIPRGRSEIERLVDVDAPPVERDGVIYTVTYQGRLAAIRIDSGQILWVRDVSSYTGMELDSHKIYLTDAEGRIWALDRFNGATLWVQDALLHRTLSGPTFQGRYIVVGDFNGFLHWITRSDGELIAITRLGYEPLPDSDVKLMDDDMLFSKSRNILARPLVEDNLTLAINRSGLLAAFRVGNKL